MSNRPSRHYGACMGQLEVPFRLCQILQSTFVVLRTFPVPPKRGYSSENTEGPISFIFEAFLKWKASVPVTCQTSGLTYRTKFVIRIHDAVYELEQCAFYQGFYKALAFAAYPCSYCNECIVSQSAGVVDLSLKRVCRHSERVRPSMEAVGIDVFSTVRKLHLPIEVIPCEDNVHGRIMHTHLNSYGLLLID